LIFTMFGGFAAVFASRRVRARGEVLLVGLQVGLVNVMTLIVLRMLKLNLADFPSLLGALLSGIAAAFGTLVLLVLFERMFGIITDLRLLELTGLRNPLIAQFEEKSPGSYQHVLNVVKLAEAAAQAIGANYLLTRAGAYFHDIGKMIKPKYFSENQVTLDDKKAHSRLSPYMSVLIIKNHVKEGVELARRFHLPKKVVDFIPQHHGTGLIRYFYSEAMKRYAESGAVDEPREEDFRYPGPKPQSIEAAVVMLADSVDAVASSKFTGGQVSEGELRKLVQTTITEKFDDGQFDECDLTMRHLHLIRESFVKTLMGRFHFRVAYPALPPKREVAAAPRVDAREPAIAIAGPTGSPS
jgi:putative nucleotidyltransferase with HDIG domain